MIYLKKNKMSLLCIKDTLTKGKFCLKSNNRTCDNTLMKKYNLSKQITIKKILGY